MQVGRPGQNATGLQYVNGTPVAAAAGKLSEDARAGLEREVVAGWESFAEDGALVLEVDVTTATGRRR